MGKKVSTSPILLRWSDHVPASDVQDPLGLGLRGSTRLASRLLFCITSITPRARYFSFIPWCICDHREHEKGRPHALGLRDGIIIREQALTLACIAHHEGEPCSGGGLVGSRDAKKWFASGRKEANFKKMKKFSKNPALGAYLNSLVNLGLFVTDAERPDSDEEETDADFTFDDIELSALGLDLAKRFDRKAGKCLADGGSVSRLPNGNQLWMLVGFELFRTLGRQYECVETYPQAGVHQLKCALRHKSTEQGLRSQIDEAAKLLGVSSTELRAKLRTMGFGSTHDRLDAFLSAWVASLDEQGRQALGTPPSDVIWVPTIHK